MADKAPPPPRRDPVVAPLQPDPKAARPVAPPPPEPSRPMAAPPPRAPAPAKSQAAAPPAKGVPRAAPPPPRTPARPAPASSALEPAGPVTLADVDLEPIEAPTILRPSPAFPKAPDRSTPRKTGATDAVTRVISSPPPAPATPDQRELDQRVVHARALITVCESELKSRPEKLRAMRLHYECARLFETPIGDLKSAADHYQKALAMAPDHVPTLEGARRVLIQQKSYQAALPLFDAQVRLTASPRQKAALLYSKGRLLEDQMGLKREAREAFETAADLNGQDLSLLKAVERAAAQAGSWDSLDRILERSANSPGLDARHRAAKICERARLAEVHKGDSRLATDLYLAAVEVYQNAPGALMALKRLNTAQQRWRDLIDVLGREAEQTSDPLERALVNLRIAGLERDRIGNLEAARVALERAAEDAPTDRMVWEELARCYELGQRREDHARALRALVGLCPSSSERVGYWHQIAGLEEELQREDQAIEAYSHALEEDPAYLPALQALTKIYQSRALWEPLIAIWLRETDAVQDGERRAAAHARVADILEHKLMSPERAMQQHARALGLFPGYPPSFKALTRLYGQAAKFGELAELYERAVDAAPDSGTKITYLLKIGRLHEDALSAPEQAVVAYRRVLALEPGDLGTLHALQRAAERAGLWKELVSALDLEIERTPDKKRPPLLHRAAQVFELHLEDTDAALGYYKKALQVSPDYLPVLDALGELYYRAGRWDDLLETYRAQLKVIPQGPGAAALLYKMGEIYERQLARDDDAIAAFREAVTADPLHMPALHALERMFSERAQWKDVARTLELEQSGIQDPKAIARTAFRLGEVYENQLSLPDKALAAYERALASDPGLGAASDGRLRLVALSRDNKKLVEELLRRAEQSRDASASAAAWLAAGELLRDEIKDPRRAAECFEKAVEKAPQELGALLALERIYLELGNWDALARVYTAEVQAMANNSARVAALRELARLQERKNVGTPEQLRQTYFSILEYEPEDPDALGALEQLALASGDQQLLAHVDAKLAGASVEVAIAAAHTTRLAEALEVHDESSALELYRSVLARDAENIAACRGLSRLALRRGDPVLLEEAATAEARATGDHQMSARLLESAASARARGGDAQGAITALLKALEINPDDTSSAQSLRQRMLELGQLDPLVEALSRAARAAKKREHAAELWVSVADLLAEHRQDLPAALAALKRVEITLPGYVPALLKQAQLYARDAQWKEAAERLGQVLKQSTGQDVQVQAHLGLSAIFQEHLKDPGRARGSAEAVLRLDDKNPEALHRLLKMQIDASELDQAAETAAKLVRVSPQKEARAEVLALQASVERQRGQLDAAAQSYEQAVMLVGTQGDIAHDFKNMLAAARKGGERPAYNRYIAALTRFVEGNVEPEPAASAYLELGRTLARELEQSEAALTMLRRGLAANPDHLELRIELAAGLSGAGKLAEALEVLRQLLELDVMREQTWRDVAQNLKAMHRDAEAGLAVAPLVALGRANDLELSIHAARPPRPASAQPGSLDADALRDIDVAGSQEPASQLLAAISESLERAHPPELERYGVSSRDRIGARSGHPLRVVGDRIAAIFGIGDYDLYPHRAKSNRIDIEFTDPVSLLVPQFFGSCTESQQVFLVGRVMAVIARGLHAVEKLPPQVLEVLLAAAARNSEPNFGQGLADEEALNAQAKRIYRAISWGRRRALEETAEAYAKAPRVAFVKWVGTVRRSAARAAVLVADDLPGCVTLVRQTEGDLSGAQGASLIQAMMMAEDMLRFWVSDAAFSLRRRIGMA